MSVVQYFIHDGQKMFNVEQAVMDGWHTTLDKLPISFAVVDRNKPEHRVVVSSITHDRLFNMWFVHFAEGGWLCLDDAIEQFMREE